MQGIIGGIRQAAFEQGRPLEFFKLFKLGTATPVQQIRTEHRCSLLDCYGLDG